MMMDVGSQNNLVIIFTFNLPEGTYLSGHVYSCISADNEGEVSGDVCGVCSWCGGCLCRKYFLEVFVD